MQEKPTSPILSEETHTSLTVPAAVIKVIQDRMHPTSVLELTEPIRESISSVLFDTMEGPQDFNAARAIKNQISSFQYVQVDIQQPHTIRLLSSKPDLHPVVVDQKNVLEDDPLNMSEFQPVDSFNDLTTAIANAFSHGNLLGTYHSNVLPVIGSSGCGKSRLIQQLVSTKGEQDVLAKEELTFKTVYLTFPRLQDNQIQKTWPRCPNIFRSWLQKTFASQCTILRSVCAFQCFLVSLLEHSLNSTKSNCEDFYKNVTDRATELYSTPYDTLKKFTRNIAHILFDQSEKVRYVIFLDEVGTLVNNNNFDDLSFIEDSTWNLYRSLRHAARNLLVTLRCQFKVDTFLVVVTGTNCNLANFCHSDLRIGSYRAASQRSHELSPPSGKTLPPVLVCPPQLDPSTLLTTTQLYEPISPLLSHGLAVSMRPLWIAYCFHDLDLSHYLSKQIQQKVDNALEYSASKVSAKTSYNTVLSALLLTCCLNSVLPHHVLSTLVECSFASVVNADFDGTNDQEEVFLSVPLVDPLIAACCWCNVMGKVLDSPDIFFGGVKQLFSLLIFSGASASSISLISESIAGCILLYLFACARSLDQNKRPGKINEASDYLHPVSLSSVMNLYEPSTEKIVTISYGQRSSKVPPCDPSKWYVNANHVVPMPFAFPNNSLKTVSEDDLKKLQFLLLDAFVFRLMFVCSPRNVAFDLLVPVLSEKALGLSYDELHELISIGFNVGHYIGVLKVSVKTGDDDKLMQSLMFEKLQGQPNQLANFNLGISFTKQFTSTTLIGSYVNARDLQHGWIINVSNLSHHLTSFYNSFSNRFKLPHVPPKLRTTKK
ncbi:hypothetical protein GEMRC1_011183 [Eukaryota sp. GEM-RC1]